MHTTKPDSLPFSSILERMASLEWDSSVLEQGFRRVLTDNTLTHSQISGFLMALRMRPLNSDMFFHAASIMQSLVISPHTPPDCLDVCGTGGDYSGSFNISTTVALLLAQIGVKIVKHGNRSVSSKSGSADVLEALGIQLDVPSDQVYEHLRRDNFCFLYAPLYHSSLKEIGKVRKDLGIRTIFNLLGPLVNPACPPFQLIGVSDKDALRPMAEAIAKMGKQHVWLVRGQDGLDEISIHAKTDVIAIKQDIISEFVITPADHGIRYSAPQTIKGGSAQENANLIQSILDGQRTDAAWDIVRLNAACGLVIIGRAQTIDDGLKTIDDHMAQRKSCL